MGRLKLLNPEMHNMTWFAFQLPSEKTKWLVRYAILRPFQPTMTIKSPPRSTQCRLYGALYVPLGPLVPPHLRQRASGTTEERSLYNINPQTSSGATHDNHQGPHIVHVWSPTQECMPKGGA